MADETGATPRELLIEASRRNNTTLLTTLLATFPSPTATAKFLNTTTDALGSSALHLAARAGSYEVLDLLLDQEGVEIDHQETREGDTCLHSAVRYCNAEGLDGGNGRAVVEILLDAGCDPRIRNKARLRAVELLERGLDGVRGCLLRAEVAVQGVGDVVVEDEEDDGRGGAGSESD